MKVVDNWRALYGINHSVAVQLLYRESQGSPEFLWFYNSFSDCFLFLKTLLVVGLQRVFHKQGITSCLQADNTQTRSTAWYGVKGDPFAVMSRGVCLAFSFVFINLSTKVHNFFCNAIVK